MPPRLKPKIFFKVSVNLEATNARTTVQTERTIHLLKWMESKESEAPGHAENEVTWKSLDRLWTGFGRTKVNTRNGYFASTLSFGNAGKSREVHTYINAFYALRATEDLMLGASNTPDVAHYWTKINCLLMNCKAVLLI